MGSVMSCVAFVSAFKRQAVAQTYTVCSFDVDASMVIAGWCIVDRGTRLGPPL